MRSKLLCRAVLVFVTGVIAGLLDPTSGLAAGRELTKIKAELRQALAQKDARKLGGLIIRMSRLDDPAVVPYLLEAAIRVPSARNYDAAAKAIARYRDEKVVDKLIDLAKRARDFRHRVLLLEGFGRRSDAPTREAIYDALDDKLVHVQVAAIQACVSRQEKEAVPRLIDLLEKEEKKRSRGWIEARTALLALTAQDFDSVDDWRKFWDANKSSLDPKKLDRSKGPTRVVVKKREDSVEFFGEEIFSQNVVFVIDVSGSMVAYDPDPDYQGDNIQLDRQRLKRAKEQLLRAIRKLRRGSRFNVITYSDKVLEWKKRILPATMGNLRLAAKYVNGFKAFGWTHTDEALEKAFADPGIDTIVLLSDGAPMKADQQDPRPLIEKIITRVRDVNASRKLKINTFGFEGMGVDPRQPQPPQSPQQPAPGARVMNPMVEFLKKLASENGGSYRPIK